MRKTYEPDSQFVERLEWQLASEFRRLDRMKVSRTIAVPRRVVTMTVMAGILMTGVAAMKAADYIKDSWRKKIEMARVDAEVELKKARLESIKELAARTEQLYANGMIRDEEFLVTKTEVERAQQDLERSMLNLEEVKASGLPPRDELHAPLAGGRDFVSERLRTEIRMVEADLKVLASRWERAKELVEKSLAPKDEAALTQAAIEARTGAIEGILKRIDLRKRFVAGEITAQEVELAERMTAAEGNLNEAQLKAHALRKQLERLQALEARGMVSPLESAHLRYALDTAQAELKLATVEIEVLKKVKY